MITIIIINENYESLINLANKLLLTKLNSIKWFENTNRMSTIQTNRC